MARRTSPRRAAGRSSINIAPRFSRSRSYSASRRHLIEQYVLGLPRPVRWGSSARQAPHRAGSGRGFGIFSDRFGKPGFVLAGLMRGLEP